MTQSSTQRWSPSAVLGIITADDDISCAGITLKGLRCRWELGGDPKLQARDLLLSMSQRPPREALDNLPQLARLCLCQKNHQQQAARVVEKWTALIEPYASSHEREGARHTHRPVDHGSNTSSMSSKDRVHTPGSSGPKLNVDEIIAEMNALSIRHAELRSMLQDAHLSESESSRESSRAGQDQRRSSPSSHDGWKRVFGRGKQPIADRA